MNPQITIVFGMTLLGAGCAGVQHQTGESEPYGLVRIVKPTDYAVHLRSARLDGSRVSVGRDYRVKPGEHLVTIKVVEGATSVDNAFRDPPAVGGAFREPATFNDAFTEFERQQRQRSSVNVDERHGTYTTNSFSVEAGWRYELDGYSVKKTRLTTP